MLPGTEGLGVVHNVGFVVQKLGGTTTHDDGLERHCALAVFVQAGAPVAPFKHDPRESVLVHNGEFPSPLRQLLFASTVHIVGFCAPFKHLLFASTVQIGLLVAPLTQDPATLVVQRG